MSDEIKFNLYEEIDPEEAQDQGFKTTRTLATDRDDIYYSRDRTAFSVEVRRLYSANGFVDAENEDETKRNMTKVSVMVFEIWLHSTAQNHHFEELQVTCTIEDEPNPTSSLRAKPALVQWAPFRNKTSVNRTVEHQRLKTAVGGDAGVSYYADLKVRYHKEKEVEKEVEYFEEWQSSPTNNPATGFLNGIRMSGIANQGNKKNRGLFGTVRFAVLVRRDEAVPYIGRFQIRTKAGAWENIVSQVRRWIGLDPRTTILKLEGADDYVHAAYPDGEAIKAKVNHKRLLEFGDLKKLEDLVTSD